MIPPVRPLGDLPLSRSALDRDQIARGREDVVATALEEPQTRVLRVAGGRVPVRSGGLELVPAREVHGLSHDGVVYLGRTIAEENGVAAGTALLLVTTPETPDPDMSADGVEWINPRDVAHRFSDRDAGIAAQALAVGNWHRSSRFCSHCGAETVVRKGGWMRSCPVCGTEHFPRTDPAVIVRVVHDDRILLGSSLLWPEGRYSLLAGFVEAGESLEAAVLREVEEESGMRLASPAYLGSQPWPFPRSIMFGFHAELAPGQDPSALVPDAEELRDVRWFSREELTASDSIAVLPGSTSIARAIIDDWLSAGSAGRRAGGAGDS